MDKDFFKGIKIALSFFFTLSILFGIVFAVGFHSANEILGGVFQGNYTVNGTFNAPNIDQNLLSNTFRATFGNSWGYQSLENGFLDSFINLNYINSTSSNNITLESSTNTIANYNIVNANFSSSGWSGNTGSFSWTGNSVSGSNANIAIINSKNFSLGTSISFDATPAHGCFILISSTERGSFSTGSDYCGSVDTTFSDYIAVSLYNSGLSSGPHYIDQGEDYVSASVSSAYSSGDTITVNVDSSGAIKVYQNGVLDHTFSNTFSGTFAVILSNGNNNGGATWDNFSYIEENEATNSNLISNNIELEKNYSNFEISIFKEDTNEPVTINTDLKAYIIDNVLDSIYEITLEEGGNISSNMNLFKGNIRLPTPSNNVKYNISTFNSKSVKYHGVGMMWG